MSLHYTWHQRREIEEHVVNGGRLTVEQCRCLIEDADAGEQAQDTLDALRELIEEQLGYRIQDVTTDDDEGTTLALIPIDEEPVPYA